MARGNKRARMEAGPAEETFSDGSSGSSAAAPSGPSTSQPQFEMEDSDEDDEDSEQAEDQEAEDSDEGPRAAQFLAESDLDDMSDEDSQQDSENESEEQDDTKVSAAVASGDAVINQAGSSRDLFAGRSNYSYGTAPLRAPWHASQSIPGSRFRQEAQKVRCKELGTK